MGSGFRVFAAGEVLTAANVNNYLQEQVIAVFASEAARGSAIASPEEGQFAFLTDTDTLTYYDGSAWQTFTSGGGGTGGFEQTFMLMGA